MQYAIELYFDRKTEEQLYDLAKSVANAKLSTKFLEWKTRPHLTLACFNDVDEEKSIELLKNFAQTHRKMSAHIASVGMFNDTKTIFASPIMTSSMYQIQREIHDCLCDFDTRGQEWYLPNRWVPHCGIALMKEDAEESFYKACDLVLREFEKISGKFTSIGLVKITFPVKEIFVAELKGE